MQELGKSITEILTKNKYNGSILVSVDDEVIYTGGFGYANFEHKILNTQDTVFRIASITKQFTASAILKLVESGKVNLEWTIDKYFPEYKHGKKVTIHHLMSNSAGIPNFDLNMDFYDVLKSNNLLVELIHLVKDQDLLFKPGSAFYYSISGFLMLQYIVEQESGMDFEAFLRHNFFDVLGMDSTGMENPKKVISNKAYGYCIENGQPLVSNYLDMRIAGGGGGLYSTVNDLFKWNLSLLHSKVLNTKSTDLIFSEHIRADEQNCYGYGMIIAKGTLYKALRMRFYHTGGGPGVRSLNAIYPEENIQFIFLSNTEDKITFNLVTEQIQELVLNS